MFNVEKYIAECIESILKQNFTDFEIIVIDDCSTDRSAEIVKNYDDPRIKLYRRVKNFGRSSARNMGVDLSHGKYIYFMDSDDMIHSNLILTLYQIAEETRADIVYMNSWYEVNEDFVFAPKMKVRSCTCNNPNPREITSDLMLRLRHEYMNRDVEVPPWIKIQRRDFIIENHLYFPEITRDEDGLFNFAELCYVKRALVVDGCGYFHRNYSTQTSGLSAEHQIRQAIDSLPETIRYMDEILQSINISSHDRSIIETRQIIHLFRCFILRSYLGELPHSKIEEIIYDSILNSTLLDANLIRAMFHALAFKIEGDIL